MIRTLLLAGLLAVVFSLQPQVRAEAQTKSLVGVVFDEIEKRAIRDYFEARERGAEEDGKGKGKSKDKGKGKSGDLPPGLAKRDELPPGLEKQLERNGKLPPGLEKRSLPRDLETRLRRRERAERVIVGSDVLLVQRATGVILDILRNVVRH